MRKFLTILATAGLVAFGSGVASAQEFRVRVGGDDGPRHHRVERERWDRPVTERRYMERRVERPRTRTVCRTVIREHVRGNGVVVRRPSEVCRQVVAGGRRVYVD